MLLLHILPLNEPTYGRRFFLLLIHRGFLLLLLNHSLVQLYNLHFLRYLLHQNVLLIMLIYFVANQIVQRSFSIISLS